MNFFIRIIKTIISPIFLFFISCNFVEKVEILRARSPDSIVDAVLVKTNAGATTSFGYLLYIVPAGRLVKKGEELLKADHVEGLEIVWKKTKFLEIKYKKARIFFFSNFWHSKELNNFQYKVELRLKPLNDNSSIE